MQQIISDGDTKKNSYYQSFQDVEIEKQYDQLEKKNALSIKYYYDEMGFENWFYLEDNYTFQKNLSDLHNRLKSDAADNEIYNYTGLLYSEVYQKFLSDKIFSTFSHLSMLSNLYKHLSRKIISSYLWEFSEENYETLIKCMQVIGNQAVIEKHLSGNTQDYDIFLKTIREIISTSAKQAQSKINQIILK